MKDYPLMFMKMAGITADQSNCVKYKTGCVVVRDDRIILQGYNGTISGAENCHDRYILMDMRMQKIRDDHRQWSDAFEIHAEMNVLAYAARKGIALEGTTMYCTHNPCSRCLKHLIQAGIKKVIYQHEFPGSTALHDSERDQLLKYISVENYYEVKNLS